MSFDFGKLDLSGIDADSGPTSSRIDVGNHNVKITSAAVEKCNNPAHSRVRVYFADDGGKTILNDFNVVNANAQAVEIGLSQLKSLLECAKHPTPNNPKDISSLKGLSVQIDVRMGRKRDNGDQYPEIKAFLPVGEMSKSIDDEIPF